MYPVLHGLSLMTMAAGFAGHFADGFKEICIHYSTTDSATLNEDGANFWGLVVQGSSLGAHINCTLRR